MKIIRTSRMFALLVATTFSSMSFAFNPLGDLNKGLKGLSDALKGAEQPEKKSDDKEEQPENSERSNLPGLPSGLAIPGLGGGPVGAGDMFSKTAELERETNRGPVGRLQLGFNQIGSVYGGYPTRLSANDPKVKYIGQIIRTLAGGSRVPYPYRGWLAVVVNGPGDASAAAGGLILVQSGLFSIAQTEDELAAVLAHELAHVEIDHSGWDFKMREGSKVFDSLMSGSDKSAGMTLAQSMYAVGTMRGYSVQAEVEADERALELLESAGYNPYALLRVIERITGEKAKPITGVRYAYIQEVKARGANEAGGGNKYPAERATLLLEALRERGLSDTQDHPARTERFKRIVGG